MYLEERQDRLAKTAVQTRHLLCVTVARHRPTHDTFQIDKPLQIKLFLAMKRKVIDRKKKHFYQCNWRKQSKFASLRTKYIDPVRPDMKSIHVVHCKELDTRQLIEQTQKT